MLAARVGGTWLRTIGPYTDLTMSHVWPHGSEQLSWRMSPTFRHSLLERGGLLVEGFDTGQRIWRGRLAQPATDGQFTASGSWSEAAGVLAIDGSGNATNVPDTAIDAAISRGAVSWTRPASVSSAAWGTASEPMRLVDLLDQAMAGLGIRWYVNADGEARALADPTTPAFVIPQVATGQGLTLADDDYYSHLTGTYLAAGPVFVTVTVGDAAAATRWGRREALVDLTDMGVITAPTATAQLNARLALTGARLQFAESLQVGYGQITTTGGTPVALSTPRAGQMVRLVGVTDNSRPGGNLPYTDIVIGRSAYTDGEATATLSPVNLASRNLEELLVQWMGT